MNDIVKSIYNSMLTKHIDTLIVEREFDRIYELGLTEVKELVPSPAKTYNLKDWAKKLLKELIDDSGS